MTLLIWGAFVLAVLALLALDLGVFNRRPHEISATEALGWTAFWVTLALAFNVLVFWLYENNWMGAGLAWSALYPSLSVRYTVSAGSARVTESFAVRNVPCREAERCRRGRYARGRRARSG